MHRQHSDQPFIDLAALATAIAAAQARARGLRNRLRLQAADEEDVRQSVLLDLICRAARFDPGRGPWPAFVSVVTRNATLRLAKKQIRLSATITQLDEEHDLADERCRASAINLGLDLQRAIRQLPRHLRSIVVRIAETGSLSGAQHASDMSRASFYRAVRDLRLRLIAHSSSPNTFAPLERSPDRTFGSTT